MSVKSISPSIRLVQVCLELSIFTQSSFCLQACLSAVSHILSDAVGAQKNLVLISYSSDVLFVFTALSALTPLILNIDMTLDEIELMKKESFKTLKLHKSRYGTSI